MFQETFITSGAVPGKLHPGRDVLAFSGNDQKEFRAITKHHVTKYYQSLKRKPKRKLKPITLRFNI